MSKNFEDYEIQHQAVSYLYCLKYYEVLEGIRRKEEGEVVKGLGRLMEEGRVVGPAEFIGVCQQAKSIVK